MPERHIDPRPHQLVRRKPRPLEQRPRLIRIYFKPHAALCAEYEWAERGPVAGSRKRTCVAVGENAVALPDEAEAVL